MEELPESEKMQQALTKIRGNLERMRAESRESLRRLAATREAADVLQAARIDEQRTSFDAAAPPA